MKTLEDQLNERADAVLQRHIEDALKGLRDLPKNLGDTQLGSLDLGVSGAPRPSLDDTVTSLRTLIFHGLREAWQEIYRGKFITRIDEMRKGSVDAQAIRELYLTVSRVKGDALARAIFEEFKVTTGTHHLSQTSPEERYELFRNLTEALSKEAPPVPEGLEDKE